METNFRRVVEHIFNNWTALKLSVDHCSGGPNSKEVAVQFVDYIVQYCLNESNIDVDSIEEALDDVMDQEFDTICEDGSTKEIAILLNKFRDLLVQGNTSVFEQEYQKLAINTVPVQTKAPKGDSIANAIESDDDDEEEDDVEQVETPMEEDSAWVQVKSRRKR